MKILNVSLTNFSTNFKKQNSQNKKQNTTTEALSYPKLTASQYLAFCGGYSIDLAQTYSQLKDEQYPIGIQKAVLETLENGNKENKTLYDIHFEKYKGILDCYSLDELKEKFPEFSDVISANDVETTPESFIGKFQNNELELFSQDEDLTLQLIKLYWGQGFSLTDLSDYIARNDENNQGINLYYAMTKKLNIPIMNRRYALVLKLSNKEYNEKFTSEMSIRLKEAKEAKLQKAQGEPVVIPRGELSEAHKEHISRGLKKYYLENPNKIYEMSQRQKRFYEENPQKREELSQVASRAWRETTEGASVLRALIKFAKKDGTIITAEELKNPFKLDSKKNSLLAAFWKRNVWAKDKFSAAMKKSWAVQKTKQEAEQRAKERMKAQINMREYFTTIEGEKMRFSLMPSPMREQAKSWAEKKGYETSNLVINEAIIHRDANLIKYDSLTQESIDLANEITNNFLIEHETLANARVTCLLRAIIKLQKALNENKNLPESLQDKQEKINVMDYKLSFLSYAHDLATPENTSRKALTKEFSSEEVEEIYNAIMEQAIALECYDFGEYMDKLLDKSYKELKAYGKI